MLRGCSLGLQRPGQREWREDPRGGQVPGLVQSRPRGPSWMRVIKPRRARAALVPGEQLAERGVHTQVAASATRQSWGRHRPSHPRAQPPPAASLALPPPTRLGSAPRAHALCPPLKGPVRSRLVLRLLLPSLPSKLPLGCGWAFARLLPLSPGAVKLVRSRGRSLQYAKLRVNSGEIPGSGDTRSGVS